MQSVAKDVMSKGVVVAQVTVPVFDGLDEAEEKYGEEKCIAYINRGVAIEMMDNARREATGGTVTGVRELLKKLKDHPEIVDKIKELLGES